MSDPDGNGQSQYCPRCGGVNKDLGLVFGPRKCVHCSWKIVWVGPLWGMEAKNRRSR